MWRDILGLQSHNQIFSLQLEAKYNFIQVEIKVFVETKITLTRLVNT